MKKFCYSCGAPVELPEFKGLAENYCKYCTDGAGNLKSKEEIRTNLAGWFKEWQPNLDEKTALTRVGYYMQSMPAWAGK